jgi:hypothetical protein
MDFRKRKQWEGMFEDGVIVEGIETGEAPSVLLTDDADESTLGATAPINGDESGASVTPALTTEPPTVKVVRKTDDVNTFLQTVDLAGVPQGAYSAQSMHGSFLYFPCVSFSFSFLLIVCMPAIFFSVGVVVLF